WPRGDGPGRRALAPQSAGAGMALRCGLSALRSYWSQFPDAPDFVVMIFTGESLFRAACQCDPWLIDHAVDQSAIPVSPTTLITMLQTVEFGWRQERIAESTDEIRSLDQELYDRLRVLAEHLQRVGAGLKTATTAYN